MARNVCWKHHCDRNPERERLRRRFWHLLTKNPRFALWRTIEGRWLCALRGQGALSEHDLGTEIPELVVHHLWLAEGPVPFQELLSFVSEASNASPMETELASNRLEAVPDSRPDAMTNLANKRHLAALWSEICTLPERQVAALLLGLRDGEGRSALLLPPVTGTASIRQIAAALRLGPGRLYKLWNRLPLEDQGIAQLFSLSRQQVINLRKEARERLARRMGKRGFDR